MSVLIDSSIWINYFRDGENSSTLDFLIDENLVSTNNLILTELIPFLKMQKQYRLIQLLQNINRFQLDVNWQELQKIQILCLEKGINGIGIPDLIIAQNCIQNNAKLYTQDKHFVLLQNICQLECY